MNKAQQLAAETSGATSGARVAPYLRGEAEAASPSEAVLSRLTLPEAPAAPAQAPGAKASPASDEKKLDDLTRAGNAAPDHPVVAAPEKPADLSKADEKLSSLLGKKE